ncbi:MAG: hypothetical protein M1812_002715 [Candelaria pacifica]|nr:MAG: hypothetical protein M1812_002715 [Candelaria pacifica]
MPVVLGPCGHGFDEGPALHRTLGILIAGCPWADDHTPQHDDGQRPDGSVPGERRSPILNSRHLKPQMMMTASSLKTASVASSSSFGSNIFSIFALLSISLSVLLLLRYYLPLRKTPAYLLVPIFLALALPVSIILLVPIDLASSAGTDFEDTRGIWLPETVILVAWRILYWLTFALTWVILPLLADYADAGYRTPKDRLLYSLQVNGRYQLMVLSCATAGLIYYVITSGFNTTSLKSLIMALAYCWGLVLAIYLMGHGLVAIPRRLYRNADISGRLRRMQHQAPKVHDRLMDSISELEELEGQLVQLRLRKTGIGRDYQDWIEELSDSSGLPEARPSLAAASRGTASVVPNVVTEYYLAALSRKLKQARHKRARFVDEWDRLVQDAADTQTILDASASHQLDFGKSSPEASFVGRFTILTPYTRYLLHTKVAPSLRYGLSVIFSIASICIIWSELIKFVLPKFSVIALTVVHYPNSETGQIGFAGQVIGLLWILYMCAAALSSITDVKVWGNRALVRRNTYGESACWYSSQIAKLTVPLTYNFITFLPVSIHQSTTFYHFLGRLIDFTPLGKGFDYFFPILVLVPVLATLFNLYGRVKRVFGFGILDDEDEDDPSGFGTGGWREGRDLIERELNGNSSLGLSARDDATSATQSARGLSVAGNGRSGVPAVVNNTSSGNTPSLHVPQHPAREQGTPQRQAVSAVEPEDDENFFQGFAHRIKNTFDTSEAPRWMSGLGDGIKKPKWMGGADEVGESGRADHGAGLGRWFGGRPSDGRVRL